MIIKVIVKNEREVVQAEKFWANRLELIPALSEGGLTPSYSKVCRKC